VHDGFHSAHGVSITCGNITHAGVRDHRALPIGW
jgi:hypothetical protein